MSRPLILFAHGAGASSSSPWMKRWASALKKVGDVVAFDYPYMKRGSKAPDRLPKLIEAHREVLRRSRERKPRAGKIVLAGKSMGSRVGCHLSLEEAVDGAICLGYPLRSPKGEIRDEVLKSMKVPILFVSGTRDPLCPLPELAKVRKRLKNRNQLHVVETGNHSLEITKKHEKETGRTQADSDLEALDAVRRFVDGL